MLKEITAPALITATLISLFQGLRNALSYSQDFQYSPAKLFLSGRNPYEVWLSGDPNGEILLSQAPNYLHHLYILFAPIGLLSFPQAKLCWALINISLAALIATLLARHYKLVGLHMLVFAGAFLCSTPVRNAIGNGQQTLLMMLALIAPFHLTRQALTLQGIGYAKYSFAPPFFLYSALTFGFPRALATLVIPGLGFYLFWLFVGGNAIELLLGPIHVAGGAVGYGVADIMSIVEGATGCGMAVSGAIAVAVLFTLMPLIVRQAPSKRHLPLTCIVSLLTLKHLAYDFAFLAPAFAYALQSKQKTIRLTTYCVTAWFWFGLKLLDTYTLILGLDLGSGHVKLATMVMNCAALSALFVALMRAR